MLPVQVFSPYVILLYLCITCKVGIGLCRYGKEQLTEVKTGINEINELKFYTELESFYYDPVLLLQVHIIRQEGREELLFIHVSLIFNQFVY
jgi:hypothetical protein